MVSCILNKLIYRAGMGVGIGIAGILGVAGAIATRGRWKPRGLGNLKDIANKVLVNTPMKKIDPHLRYGVF